MRTNNQQPVITIITASYNDFEGLLKTNSSIKSQDYENLEWIIADGASTDKTLDFLVSKNNFSKKWFSQEDSGIYQAWNNALKNASGEWILFLGAGDTLHNENTLKFVAEKIKNINGNYKLAYGGVRVTAKNSFKIIDVDWADVKEKISYGMSIPHPGMMHHRSIFSEYGQFNEEYKIAGDFDFILREIKINSPYYMSETIVSNITAGGISMDPKNTLLTLFETKKALKDNGIKLPLIYWAYKTVKDYIKYSIYKILGDKCYEKIIENFRKI
jgi:glycosyltransferase involved in cell wall biosynthesis